MKFNEQLDTVRTLRDNLEGRAYKATWHPATRTDNGVLEMGYPEYEPWLLNGIRAIRYLLSKPMGGRRSRYAEIDINNYEAIPQASVEELTDWIFNLWRGEKLCDGHIAQATELGCTLAMANRTIKLAEEWLQHHPQPEPTSTSNSYDTATCSTNEQNKTTRPG